MLQRGLTEVDLRAMLDDATDVEQARAPGRWLLRTMRERVPWVIVLEPDIEDRLLVVVTVFSPSVLQ
jgi:hypothetical protein